MSRKSEKKIETFQVVITSDEDYSFEDFLKCNHVTDSDVAVRGKDVSFRILENKDGCIIGLVETSRNRNIPPKREKKSKKVVPLGLANGDGLAYANIFLYEKKRRILMYEVNKNGCYIDHFRLFIYKCLRGKEDFQKFNIDINPVLKTGSYEKVLNMRLHKSIEVKLANPSLLLEKYSHKNDAISNAAEQANKLNSDKAQFKMEVSMRGRGEFKTTGLASQPLKTILDRALKLLETPYGENLEKIEIVGYEHDSDDNKAIPIDFVADRYLKFIELDEPRENSDLLENQRKKEIKKLYDKCKKDFDKIFKV